MRASCAKNCTNLTTYYPHHTATGSQGKLTFQNDASW